MWKASFAVLLVLLAARQINGDCNVCNTNNGAACTSNTTFQLCFNGVAQGVNYSCPNAGDVCTNLGQICLDPESNTAVEADCGNTEQCGRCTDVTNYAYACTSHTTFVMCSGNLPTNVTSTCPQGFVCLTSRANAGISPCVNQCLKDVKDMCDIEAADSSVTDSTTITTVTTASTATTVTDSSSASTGTTLSPEDAVCAGTTLVGRYPYPNDTVCRTYVYCSINLSTGVLYGRPLSCPGVTYFNPSINRCQAAVPTGCVA
ncbi:unnamed protein product [Ceratitis capitata]|uniref:(Mediterranean fruit fly) hypothetical protein n=1 Tax=Ceratitis capitata TaxID=7213 RepID=A0A811UY47_CERCA|nr:unnamed protein product [Ceratitis capitata]